MIDACGLITMQTQNWGVGNRIDHPSFGAGTITFVGADYLGIAFDDVGEILIRRESIEKHESAHHERQEPSRESMAWPTSTFIPESPDSRHFSGSHWSPFVEKSEDLLRHMPEIVQQAQLQEGYGDFRPAPRTVPQQWPVGFQLVWPQTTQGIALTLRVEEASNEIVSLFPFFTTGGQHALILHKVSVWENGLEAQITASWLEGEVTFYDARYPSNRAWYETGKAYDFILLGLAYAASPAKKHEWQIHRHPDEVAWLNQRLEEGEEPYEADCTVRMDGAAMLLPVSGWDEDDYSFHAPVKSVTEFKDWLGQDGWRVRATVIRSGDEDGDLDILITRRVWNAQTPPQVGQDIEGQLWLQGYLWMPRMRETG
ncbi:MAG: hypothetical protein RBR52_01570 [Thiomonas sp.]|uniref:hypothetical protein n=1 Tax=Thiomonas sp. TaxID=2047785 RepID=UPI002A35BC4F|nr:hypothetical protein [Thiomonas sp.]MDY0329169.1 hypothetical protein [Thiomonas sp.]